MRHLMMICLLCVLPVSLAAAEQWALVQEESAPLLSQEDGRVMEYLGADDWVQVLETAGSYVRVKVPGGKTGFLPEQQVRSVSAVQGSMGRVANPSLREFLNLRQEPSYEAEVLGIYYNGTPCAVLGQSGNGWYHVMVDGTEGYFREEYVTVSTEPYGEEIVTVHAPGQNGVNMREGPGYVYPATRTCEAGAFLTLLSRGKDWWMVSDAGRTGFVRSSFLYDGVLNPLFQDDAVLGAYAVVNNPKATQVLNLRALPTRNSSSLKQFSNGTRLMLMQQGTEWCRVSDGEGNTGYCMTEFLQIMQGQEVPYKTVRHPDETYVNLRSLPSMTGSLVLCEVAHGEKVSVMIPDVDGWTKVYYEPLGMSGYMASMFLE